jgi:hypothetical protein
MQETLHVTSYAVGTTQCESLTRLHARQSAFEDIFLQRLVAVSADSIEKQPTAQMGQHLELILQLHKVVLSLYMSHHTQTAKDAFFPIRLHLFGDVLQIELFYSAHELLLIPLYELQ